MLLTASREGQLLKAKLLSYGPQDLFARDLAEEATLKAIMEGMLLLKSSIRRCAHYQLVIRQPYPLVNDLLTSLTSNPANCPNVTLIRGYEYQLEIWKMKHKFPKVTYALEKQPRIAKAIHIALSQ